ncbi:MAG: hypothetical protein VYA34_07480 [Myxococcota bacterium]|nr:hypothetical protein [Myxococcota bacterium]
MQPGNDPPPSKGGNPQTQTKTHDKTPPRQLTRSGVSFAIHLQSQGGDPLGTFQALNANPNGLYLATTDDPPPIGLKIRVLLPLRTRPGNPLNLAAEVVPHVGSPISGIGIRIDSKTTPREDLRLFRQTIFHSIRNSEP